MDRRVAVVLGVVVAALGAVTVISALSARGGDGIPGSLLEPVLVSALSFLSLGLIALASWLAWADTRRLSHAESELRQTVEQLSDFYDHAACGYHSLDDEGRYLNVNETELRWLGYRREDLVGKRRFSDLLTKESERVFLNEFSRFKAGGRVGDLEFDMVRSDGSVMPVLVNATAIYDASGTFVASRSTVLDLTERRRAEAALRASEERLQAIVDNAPLVFYVTDPDGRLLLLNQEAERVFRLPRDTALGRRTEDVLPASVRIDRPHWGLDGSGPDGAEFEQTLGMPEGVRTFACREFPLRAADGEVAARGSVWMDVTERVEAERTVRALGKDQVRQNITLQALNRELEAFSYSVSHDLRAPLRGIDGLSLALLEDHGRELPNEAQDYLRRIRAASQTMGAIIDDLLALSRLNRSEMTYVPVDLGALVSDTLAELRAREGHRHVVATISPHAHCIGDPKLLKLAIENLVGNAWKFTGKQGTARITFAVDEKGGEQVFSIADNGAGFDMAYADRVFNPFERLHPASEFSGTGIGLAIVQRVIDRHGGRIWAESEPQRGATFYFTLPPVLRDTDE